MNSGLIFLLSLTIQICVELEQKKRSTLFKAFRDLTPDDRIPSDHSFKNTTNLTTIGDWNDC